MSGETTDEVTAEVADTVAPDSVHSDTPSNADIMGRLDNIEALLTRTLDTTTHHVTPEGVDNGDSGDVEEPGNGEVIRDKSPASKPWTHRRLLK